MGRDYTSTAMTHFYEPETGAVIEEGSEQDPRTHDAAAFKRRTAFLNSRRTTTPTHRKDTIMAKEHNELRQALRNGYYAALALAVSTRKAHVAHITTSNKGDTFTYDTSERNGNLDSFAPNVVACVIVTLPTEENGAAERKAGREPRSTTRTVSAARVVALASTEPKKPKTINEIAADQWEYRVKTFGVAKALKLTRHTIANEERTQADPRKLEIERAILALTFPDDLGAPSPAVQTAAVELAKHAAVALSTKATKAGREEHRAGSRRSAQG